jgi:hypothetical protein
MVVTFVDDGGDYDRGLAYFDQFAANVGILTEVSSEESALVADSFGNFRFVP